MAGKGNYYTLIGSLPALPTHFEDAERVPISELQLQERLKLLDEEAAEVIERMTDFLAWERQPMDRTDEEYGQHYDSFMTSVKNAFARQLIDQALTTRTIVGALRRRRLDQGPPSGSWWAAEHIAKNWTHPDFRLAAQFPWIGEVDEQLNGPTPFELERTLLNIRWTRATRLAERYQFSFEAVVLYLIRWETVYRWTRRDAKAGQQEFEKLVNDALGEFANMFE